MLWERTKNFRAHCPVLAQGQYDEFATEVYLLAAPLRAALPQMAFTTYNVGGRGRPGIFIFGARTAGARYRFPLSVLIRWRDPAILDYLESDPAGREALRKTFAARVQEILGKLEAQYAIDWQCGSQDSGQGLVVDFEEF
jgi:hypothetical protein